MKKKTVAILIAFGPEVRSFIYSGLARNLISKHNVIIFSLLTDSQAFARLPQEIKVIKLPLAGESSFLVRFRHLLQFIHGLWLPKLGGTKWDHYLTNEKKYYAKRLIRRYQQVFTNKWSMQVLSAMENILGKTIGTHKNWQKLLVENQVDLVISAGYDDRTLPALQTARNLGKKTMIIPNSWKDIYFLPHLHFVPTKLLLWSNANADAYLRYNPWIDRGTLGTVGSLHLSHFLTQPKIMPPAEFFARTGLNPQRPFICYSAAAPAAVRNEESIVSEILSAITEQRITARPQLLLRLNPMEDGSRFAPLTQAFPEDLTLQKPIWEWRPDLDWCCSLEEDVVLWVSTVRYAALNISIPSTVTLEFLAFHKPVINVCYEAGAPGEPGKSSRRFWDSDFYGEIRQEKNVLPAFSPEELLQTLESLMHEAGGGEDLPGEDDRTRYAWERHDTVAEIAASIQEII